MGLTDPASQATGKGAACGSRQEGRVLRQAGGCWPHSPCGASLTGTSYAKVSSFGNDFLLDRELPDTSQKCHRNLQMGGTTKA